MWQVLHLRWFRVCGPTGGGGGGSGHKTRSVYTPNYPNSHPFLKIGDYCRLHRAVPFTGISRTVLDAMEDVELPQSSGKLNNGSANKMHRP